APGGPGALRAAAPVGGLAGRHRSLSRPPVPKSCPPPKSWAGPDAMQGGLRATCGPQVLSVFEQVCYCGGIGSTSPRRGGWGRGLLGYEVATGRGEHPVTAGWARQGRWGTVSITVMESWIGGWLTGHAEHAPPPRVVEVVTAPGLAPA